MPETRNYRNLETAPSRPVLAADKNAPFLGATPLSSNGLLDHVLALMDSEGMSAVIEATGVPAVMEQTIGLFRDPPVFMMPGDVIAIEAEGIGRLENRILAAGAAARPAELA